MRMLVKWPYVAMKAGVRNSVDATHGMFGFKQKAEWTIIPKLTLSEHVAIGFLPPYFSARNTKTKFAQTGSIHRFIYEIRSTGVASCHVTMTDHYDPRSRYDFDLPSTAAQDFTSELEKIGDAKIEHPYFIGDENPFHEEVSLDGPATKVSFEPGPQAHGAARTHRFGHRF